MTDNLQKDRSVATGVGAAGGAVTGMGIGAVLGGPVGAAVGGTVGAVVGGAAGRELSAAFDPEVEDAYWRENFSRRPYVRAGSNYDTYRDAYLYGGESRASGDRAWDDAKDELEHGWESAKKNSRLAWSEAKDAVRDGWHRVEKAIPGDADRDGR